MSIIKPRTAVVTIYHGDDLDKIRHLERRAEAAKDAQGNLPLLNGEPDPEYLALAQEHDDLVHEATQRALQVTVQALGRKVWNALVAEHPPRVADPENGVSEKTAREDAAAGVNEATFMEALVGGGTVTIDGEKVPYRTIVEPDLTGEDLDAMSSIDFQRLYLTAFGLNRAPVADPKASLVSRLTPKSEETSS